MPGWSRPKKGPEPAAEAAADPRTHLRRRAAAARRLARSLPPTSSATSLTSRTSIASSTSAGISSRSGAFRCGEEHGGQTGPLGGQELLLGAADRQHPAVQGDLTGHPDVGAYGSAQSHRGQGGDHGDAGRRTVLGHRSGRNVDVDVLVEHGRVGDPQSLGVGPYVGQGDLRRLLHHVPELAGQRQPASAGGRRRHRTGLDEEDVTAQPGDGEAGGHARYRGALVGLRA